MLLPKLQFEIARLFRKYVDRIECDQHVFYNLEIILMHLQNSREIYQHYTFLFKLIDFYIQKECGDTIDRLIILTFELIAKSTRKRKIYGKCFNYYYYVIHKFMKLLKWKWMNEGPQANINSDMILACGAMFRALSQKVAFRNYLQRTKYVYDILDIIQYLDEMNAKFWFSFLLEILDWPYNEPLLYTITWFNEFNQHIKSVLIDLFKKFITNREIQLQIYILYKTLFGLSYNVDLIEMYKKLKYPFINLELNFAEKLDEIDLLNFFKQYQTELEYDAVGICKFREMIELAKKKIRDEEEMAECQRLNHTYRKLRETTIQHNLEARLVNAKFFNYCTDKTKCRNIINEHKTKLLDIIYSYCNNC